MKKLLSLLVAAASLLAACTSEPPPIEQTEAPAEREIRIQVQTGILDWSAYEPWGKNPPTLLLVERIDAPTRALLQEKARLAEIILSETKPPAEKDYTAEVEQLKQRVPPRASTSYYHRDRTVIIKTDQSLIDSYTRRWRGITSENLPSVVSALKRQNERDFELYFRNANGNGQGGTQANVNLTYVRKWKPILRSAETLVERMATPLPTGERERALSAWNSFQENDLPFIERTISENLVAETSVSFDGSFTLEGSGETLIRIEVAGRQILYLKQARHRFRFFNEQTETHIETVGLAGAE